MSLPEEDLAARGRSIFERLRQEQEPQIEGVDPPTPPDPGDDSRGEADERLGDPAAPAAGAPHEKPLLPEEEPGSAEMAARGFEPPVSADSIDVEDESGPVRGAPPDDPAPSPVNLSVVDAPREAGSTDVDAGSDADPVIGEGTEADGPVDDGPRNAGPTLADTPTRTETPAGAEATAGVRAELDASVEAPVDEGAVPVEAPVGGGPMSVEPGDGGAVPVEAPVDGGAMRADAPGEARPSSAGTLTGDETTGQGPADLPVASVETPTAASASLPGALTGGERAREVPTEGGVPSIDTRSTNTPPVGGTPIDVPAADPWGQPRRAAPGEAAAPAADAAPEARAATQLPAEDRASTLDAPPAPAGAPSPPPTPPADPATSDDTDLEPAAVEAGGGVQPDVDPLRFVRPLPRILAVANQKGGVGKTTTTVNLGASLAVLGYRVLVIDLDPQGNATTGLGINSRNLEASIYDVILHDVPLDDSVEATQLRNLFVAPATIDLAGAEIELVPAFSRELRLRRALEDVQADYDFVLIDCPPSLGLLTVNALSAATEVVVPIQCEYYALEGLGQLLRNVNLVQSNLNPKLELSAIVLTMYDGRTKLAEQVADEVRQHFGDKVCRNVVPRTVRLSEAPSFGQPIIVFDPSSRGALAYRELAREVSGGPPQRTG